MIVSDTDLAVPEDIDAITFVVVGPDETRREATSELRATGLPATLALVHDGGALGPFEVVAEGRLRGAPVLERRARFSFVDGEVRVLRMDLLRDCVSVPCEGDTTCAAGGCRPVAVDEAELIPWTGEVAGLDGGLDGAIPPDGGGPDSSTDSGSDGGDVDGGDVCPSCAEATVVAAPGGRFPLNLRDLGLRGSCGGDGAEATLTFELTESSDVFVTTHGSAEDTIVYIRPCACGDPEAACNDDADGLSTSAIQTQLAPGRWMVVVDSASAAIGAAVSVDVYVNPLAAPGDRCGRPMYLPSGTTQTGDTCTMTADHNGGRCVGSRDAFAGPDLVYYVVVTGPRRPITFDTCAGCTDFNDSLDLYSVCTSPSSSPRVACGDDTCLSSCAPSRFEPQGRVETPLDPGLYYLVVDGQGSDCGGFELTTSGL
jgi:hypothetical protein